MKQIKQEERAAPGSFRGAVEEIRALGLTSAEKSAMRARIMADAGKGEKAYSGILSPWTAHAFHSWVHRHRAAAAATAIAAVVVIGGGIDLLFINLPVRTPATDALKEAGSKDIETAQSLIQGTSEVASDVASQAVGLPTADAATSTPEADGASPGAK